MGRKMKSIAALFVILGLIYWQQLSFIDAAYAKEEYGLSEDGLEEEPGEDRDDKEEVQPEPVECFQTVIPSEDGKNGYYISRPEVEICHVSKNGITRYSFTDSGGGHEEGELRQCNEKARIEKERFQEGANCLSIWMEDEKGERVEGNTFEKIFLVDTRAPVLRIQTPRGLGAWYQEEVFISAASEDGEQGSQTEEIVCFQGQQRIGNSRNSFAGFRISSACAGGKAVPVTVSVSDKAGNRTEETIELYIDRHPPKTAVEGIEPYMVTSRPVEVNYHVEDENSIEKMSAGASREDPQGVVTVLEADGWELKDAGGDVRQTLTEDGIYRLKVEASDKAGYESESTSQIIIDTGNPVIRSVDEFHGKYMKSFCWDEPAEEVIKDFTSYTYSVCLDGKPYHMGENITREGGHVLEVKAVDLAGNEGAAKAEFVIDHTAPVVVFTDIEEGGRYEEERVFKVSPENPEDSIEEIRINGEKQNVSADGKTAQYHVKECKNYEISVKACDKAGNRTAARISFKIVKKETLLHKIISPLCKTFGLPFQSEKKERVFEEGRGEEKRKIPEAVLLFTGITAAALGTGYYMLKKRL